MKNFLQYNSKMSKEESSQSNNSNNPFISLPPIQPSQPSQPIQPMAPNLSSVSSDVNDSNNAKLQSTGNKPQAKTKTLYSDYGYIEVNIDDYLNEDLKIIPIAKSKSHFTGSIAVSI